MIDRNHVETVAEALTSLSANPAPNLGLDLDAPLHDALILWHVLTHHWPGKVTGFTTGEHEARLLLQRFNLRCDELIVVETAEAKADAIYRSGVSVIVSDDVQVLRQIPLDRVRLHLI